MALATSATDLQMAIMELDILYEDLTQHKKDRKTQVTTEQHIGLSPSNFSQQMFTAEDDDDDEGDYDVPRPAESVFNSRILNTSPEDIQQHRIQTHKNDIFFHRKENSAHTNLSSTKTRSPATSVESKYSSSGIGTFRINRVAADVHLPNDDSDYDEVATDEDEDSDADYSYPVKRSYDPREHQSSQNQHKCIVTSFTESKKGADPVYDEVCSDVTCRDVIHPIGNAHLEYTTLENGKLCNAVDDLVDEREYRARHIAFSGTDDDLKQIPIEYVDEEVCDGSTLDSHLSEVVVTARPDRDSSNWDRKSSDMKFKTSGRKNDEDCPCYCPSAVPLMSCAVIICVAMLIFAAIAYIYFGLRIEKWSQTGTAPTNDGGS